MSQRNLAVVKTLTYLMFAMFAMTTDSVGIIIPEIIKDIRPESDGRGRVSIRDDGGHRTRRLLARHLADRFGRKPTIVIGLTLFAGASSLFAAGDSFVFFVVLMGLSGIAIGIFKTGALALIGDISRSTAEHTSIMNTAEGLLRHRLHHRACGPRVSADTGMSWKWLYVDRRDDVRAADRHGTAVSYPNSPARRVRVA